MKRHPSLHPLSQHHHFALIQALEMRRATELPADVRAAGVERQAAKFIRFWRRTGHVHFRQEEEILLPAYARHVRLDEDAEVIRMLADHAEIRAAVLDIEQRLEAKTPVEVETFGHLGKLLHDHVRLEENEIFPRIERALGEEQLNTMGSGLMRLHSKDDVCEI